MRVYSAETLTQVVLARNVLASAGIETELRNEHLGSVAGELPPISVWPELWVACEHDLAEAKRLISEFQSGTRPTGAPRACPSCGADVEPQFAICWRCGHSMDT